ncbi:MAG TPA: PLP-dependent aminotransferase family protein [Anaerolineales bacterium]|nr:PLP-dependent aminotransferase family protein [Anaerolineales bacterium]
MSVLSPGLASLEVYNPPVDISPLTLSSEVVDLKRSVMRDLLRLAVDPGITSLAGGLPAGELLPTAELRDSIEAVIRRDGARALQYSPPWEPLREWVSSYMLARGVACRPEDVFLTNGAQQGMALLSRLLMDRGQSAVVERVTFTGIQQVTAGRGARVRLLPTDLKTGADLDALEEALREQPRPRLVILIPDFHNPLGVSLSLEKRRRAAALAAAYGVPLLEDDPYSALRFEGETAPPIKAFDEAGLVFYIGSFSKMIAPAIRLGWIVTTPDLVARLTVLRESIDLEASGLMQRAVAAFLQAGHLEPHLQRLTAANRARRDALLSALQRELGDLATWTRPEGGLFVWVTLPPDIDTWECFQPALQRKVAYIPGAAFDLAGGSRSTLRLNFSNVAPERIPEAVKRLAQAFRGE